MDAPKFVPVAPPPPPTPHPAETAAEELRQIVSDLDVAQVLEETTTNGVTTRLTLRERIETLITSDAMNRALLTEAEAANAPARKLLQDLIASSILTDGFLTNAVAQSMLAVAEDAKKFLKEHP